MLNFTSMLKSEFDEELEQLMFFNPGQQTMRDAIVNSVEKYGMPSVYADGKRLLIKVEKLDEVQTLFALDGDKLAGVLVYSRISLENLTVIHLAVNQDYSSSGKFAQHMLVMRMLELLRSNARRIKGVKNIRITYSNDRVLNYSVTPAAKLA